MDTGFGPDFTRILSSFFVLRGNSLGIGGRVPVQ